MTTLDGRVPPIGRPSTSRGPSRTGQALGRSGARSGARLPWPVLLYLLAVLLPLSFPVGPVVMTALRLLLLALTVPLAAQLLAGRFGRVLATDLLFGAHVLWMAAALGVNSPAQVVEQVGSVGVEFLGGYLVARAYIRTPEAFGALCRAVALLVCCTLPFAVVEAVSGRKVLLDLLAAVPGMGAPAPVQTDMRLGLHRVQSTFAHPIHYGLFCSIALPLAFVAVKDVIPAGRRWLSSAAVLGCTFLSLSSGALLAAMLQLGLIAWASALAKVRSRWWLLLGLFALAYVAVDLASNRTPMRVFMSYATFSSGSAYWRAAINEFGMGNVWANPIFGIGLNDWVRPAWMHSSSVDNFWLLTTMRYGIPGFLFLAIGYATGVLRVMRRNFEGDPLLSQMRRAWVFIFLGLSFTLYTVHVWTNVYSFVFFMFGAGMWFIEASPAPSGQPPEAREPAPRRREPDAPDRLALAHTRFPPARRAGPAPDVAPRRPSP